MTNIFLIGEATDYTFKRFIKNMFSRATYEGVTILIANYLPSKMRKRGGRG